MEDGGTDGAHHFLLELRLEPREIDGAPLILRGRVRDLLSGKGAYVATFAEVEEFIDDALDASGAAHRRWAGDAPSGRPGPDGGSLR